MRNLYAHCVCKAHAAKAAGLSCKADIFLSGVINQKVVNQNAQQIMVAIAAQILNIAEAQFGFAANEDEDEVEA